MAKKKTKYVCQECGYDSLKWLGHCPGCGLWNSMVEEVQITTKEKARGITLGFSLKQNPMSISNVQIEEQSRFHSGSSELDRVLGGGILAGALVLIAGDPGVGKSSLTLRVCAKVARSQKKVLYITGEESIRQVRMRADRLNAIEDNLFVISETNLEVIVSLIENLKPELLIIDSIQTMYNPDLESAPGSVAQVRECSVELLRLAKLYNIATFLVGHVTKEGNLAGPRVLEHIVDTVLFFEGEKNAEYRLLRAVKNRFGSTNEIGVFEMRDTGLFDTPDASKLFFSDEESESGSVILPLLEGTRPLMVEVQALVTKTLYIPPRRTSDALDLKRIQLLIAVLEKRVHIPLGNSDVFVKTAGGIRIDEPAADLAICLAMASSLNNRKIRNKTIIFGEIGLSGEVRAVNQAEGRLREAIRLGFKNAIIPRKNFDKFIEKPHGINIYPVGTLSEALKIALTTEI